MARRASLRRLHEVSEQHAQRDLAFSEVSESKPLEQPWRRRVLAIALLAEVLFLARAAAFGDFFVAGNPLQFVQSILAAGVCFLAALWGFRKIGVGQAASMFWVGALAIRLTLLPCTPGDDFWRYLWEGRVQNAGFNPYLLAPVAPELAFLRDSTWGWINHPQWSTIYPPGAELLFRGLAALGESPIFYKAVFIASDLATCGILLALFRGPERYEKVAWFAWNPALAYAGAGGAHFESLLLLSMTGALWALRRATQEDEQGRLATSWALLSAALLGIAISIKMVPVFLLPVWVLALRWRSAVLLLSLAIPIALSFVYGGPRVVLERLAEFSDVTRFHDLFWWGIELITGPNPWQRNWPFSLVLGATILLICLYLRHDWERAALWVLGAVLVLSPSLHPWYLTWILPFACLRQQHAWTILSLSGLTIFLLWDSGGYWRAWYPNGLTRSMVILPPLVWGLLQCYNKRCHPPLT